MRHFALLAVVMVALAAPASAQYVDQVLADRQQESRAQSLHKQIRCLVCQNQAIADSNAELARQLRTIVRERIVAGDDDTQVKAYLVDRYGDWVLMRPPLKASTAVLWISPFVILAAVLVGALLFAIRRRKQTQSPANPLNADEESRLASILNDRA
ncbi:MAG: cytochrome c-type biogenesis protein CcmH [Proteobacteria bacterium]|nr:cytochrome c-type biogenesis protein CcmH [Pseudomonadota bacterium]